MMDQQVGVIAALPVQPGHASTTVVQINPISPANSQSKRTQGGATNHGVALCLVQV